MRIKTVWINYSSWNSSALASGTCEVQDSSEKVTRLNITMTLPALTCYNNQIIVFCSLWIFPRQPPFLFTQYLFTLLANVSHRLSSWTCVWTPICPLSIPYITRMLRSGKEPDADQGECRKHCLYCAGYGSQVIKDSMGNKQAEEWSKNKQESKPKIRNAEVPGSRQEL